MAKVYIGTSGFYYPHWSGSFYPKELPREDYLSFYAKKFSTVEINATFYHLPKEKTIENFIKRVPESFVFSFKLSRYLTHIKKLIPDQQGIERFFKSLKPAAKNPKLKNLILIQTPPSLKGDLNRLRDFCQLLPKNYLYAFEFRHQSWFTEEAYQFCQKNNFAIVFSSNPEIWPQIEVETASFFYLRFHGEKQLFASSYNETRLEKYAVMIKEKLKKGLDVYAYFNNDALGYAVEDGQRLKNMLE